MSDTHQKVSIRKFQKMFTSMVEDTDTELRKTVIVKEKVFQIWKTFKPTSIVVSLI